MFQYQCSILYSRKVPKLNNFFSEKTGVRCEAINVWLKATKWRSITESNWLVVCELDNGNVYDDTIIEALCGINDEGLYIYDTKIYKSQDQLPGTELILQTNDVELYSRKRKDGTIRRTNHASSNSRIQYHLREPVSVALFIGGTNDIVKHNHTRELSEVENFLANRRTRRRSSALLSQAAPN